VFVASVVYGDRTCEPQRSALFKRKKPKNQGKALAAGMKDERLFLKNKGNTDDTW